MCLCVGGVKGRRADNQCHTPDTNEYMAIYTRGTGDREGLGSTIPDEVRRRVWVAVCTRRECGGWFGGFAFRFVFFTLALVLFCSVPSLLR